MANDTLIVNTLLSDAKKQLRENKDSSIHLSLKALSISDSLKYINGQGQSRILLGYIYKQQYETDLSLKYLDFCENEQFSKKHRCSCYLLKGNMIRDRAEYDQAGIIYTKGLDLALDLKDTSKMSSFYNSLAILNDYVQNFEKAINFHIQSGELSLSLSDSLGYATSLQNIGIIYRQIREPLKAIENYDLALSYSIGNEGRQMLIEHLKGVAYNELKEYHNAIASYNTVIESGYDKYELQATTYLDLALAQLELNKLEEALQSARRGLKIAKSNRRKFRLHITKSNILYQFGRCKDAQVELKETENYIQNERDYETLASFYEAQLRIALCSNASNSLGSLDSFLQNMDKYYFEKKEFEAKHLAVKYETEKKELQNQLLKSENNNKESYIKNLWLWGSLVLSVALSGLGFFWFRNQVLFKDKELIQLSMYQLEDSNKKLTDQLKEIKVPPSNPTKEQWQTKSLGDDLKLVIPNKPQNIIIQLNKVVYVKSDKNYVDIYVEGRERPITYRATLKGFIAEWLPEEVFLRIHKGHVINKSFVDAYDKKSVVVKLNSENRSLTVGNTFGDELISKMA